MLFNSLEISINSNLLSDSDTQKLTLWITSQGGQIKQDADMVLTLEEIKDKISVLPHWIDDCVKLNRQIPYQYYVFPDPPIITGDFSILPVYKSHSMPLSQRTFYFYDKKIGFLFSQGLMDLGAKVSDSYNHQVTDLVIDYRKGQTFITAEKEQKAIGSSDWVKKIIKEKEWSDPKVNLIYYPIPIYPIPDLENAIITVSGYTGETRLSIAKMVVAIGATFTRYLTESHTHLISAFDTGEKYEKASSWNIHIVNLVWIEEVFQKWEYQRESSPKFVTLNTGYLHMNTRINDVEQWLVDGSDQDLKENTNSDKEKLVLLEKRALNTESQQKTVKKIRLENAVEHIVTFTGCRPTSEEENYFRSQNIQLVKSVHDSTIVVADKVARTEKFLVALSLGLSIVSKAWITESYLHNCILDTNDFPLIDTEAEGKYEFDLKKSMELAKKRKLLEGISIMSTPKVIPGALTLKLIIASAGGTYIEKPSRKEFMDFARKADLDPDHHIIISTVEERSAFSKIIPASLKMYTSEILLTGILRQTLPRDDPTMLV